MRWLAVGVMLWAAGAAGAVAQNGQFTSPLDRPVQANPGAIVPPEVAVEPLRLLTTDHAMVRGLDKVSGTSVQLDLARGATAEIGQLEVTLGECRYPEDDPSGEAYAWLDITDSRSGRSLFSGWMVASSPALNALDHPRYDVWVMRCATS